MCFRVVFFYNTILTVHTEVPYVTDDLSTKATDSIID